MNNKKNKLYSVLVAILLVSSMTVFAGAVKPAESGPKPSADLDQLRNGKASSPNDPGVWHNGALVPTQSHYIEGYSIPYRVVMKNLPTSTSITLTIGFDITKNGKHAIDYLTTYDYIDDPSHTSVYGHSQETITPLAGVSGVSGTTTTYNLPAPSSTGSPVTDQPTTSFNSLATADKKMTLYGGTITNVVYADQGDLTLATDEAQVSITFTVDSSTAVLAWGGHLASLSDWGYDNGVPRSASAIKGAPAHTRTVSWDLSQALGSQDRTWQIDPLGSLTIKKVIDWGYYTQYQNGWDFTFNPSWTSSFTLGNGDSESFTLIPGTYSVTEADLGGWALDKIIINDGDSDLVISGPTAEVDLGLGESVTITFVNKPPDFVVPENPLGTMGSIVVLLGAAGLILAKQRGFITIVAN